jgi:DNA-binding SARP family transcriptional activator/DNA-binding NarL/FixJ family response regulator
VLGPLVAAGDGRPLDLGGRRQRAVLALLLLARGDVVPAERLVDSLWGDQPPPSAAGALQAYISHLRRRLEPDRLARSRDSLIASEGPGYAVRIADDSVDAWRFERLIREASGAADPEQAAASLSEALRLWRGPAYVEYAEEPWAEAEAARLTGLRALAREQLLAARLARGESAVLVPEIEALVAEEPLREERWRLLVLALYRSHRQADALAALRRARSTLADELGVDPGPALRALEAEVLAQSPALDAPAPAGSPAATLLTGATTSPTANRAAAAGKPGAVAPDELVDRDRELTELRGCLADALDSQGRLVLVEGPAGIGKSRLLAEGRRLAGEAGALVLAARGSQLEKEFGFGAVRQLFEPLLTGPEVRAELLTGSAASAGTVFDVGPDMEQRHDGSFAVLHGLYWLTVNLASTRPLVLSVDDLQWCDAGSLRFLAYLARRLEGLPVLIVGSLRTGEPHDDEALLADLEHDIATVPIRPGPLSVDGVADLVRRRLGESADDVFIAACHRTTSGNPLLLRQLLRALEAESIHPDASHADTVTAIGSRAVSSLVLMRLGRLPEASVATARAIAVLGDGAALPTTAALAGLAESEAATALAALARAEVVRDEHPLGFVHPLVRDAVYRDLTAAQRELYHERAARVLEATGSAPEQIAAHVLQVPKRASPWVVDVLRRAAERATERGASESAVAYLTRAMEEPPSAEDRSHVLFELGRVEVLSNGFAAVDHLRAAYAGLTDPHSRAAVAQMLARTLVFVGSQGEALQFAREAAAELPGELVDDCQGLDAIGRISGYMHGLDAKVWRPGETPKLVGEGPGARMLAATLAWELFIDGVDRPGAVALARFALADGILLSVDTGLLWVVAAIVLIFAEEDVGTFWDDRLADAHAHGSLFEALGVHLWGGYHLWLRGDLPEAYHSLLSFADQMEMWGNLTVGGPYGDGFRVGVLLDLGDLAGARAFLEEIRPNPRMGDGARLFGEADAKVLMAEGRYAEALASLESVADLQTSVSNPVWRPWRGLRAQALAGLGRLPEAIGLVEEELVLARAWGAPRSIGLTLRLLGELKSPDGEPELREAVAVLSGTTARLEFARALFALATVIPDRPEGAAARLHEALDLADQCGAAGLRRSIAEAMHAAGIDAPEPSGAISLSSRERRIATMHVDGVADRDIAQAMFITPRSVRATVEAVRDRLGVTSREDLRAALRTV